MIVLILGSAPNVIAAAQWPRGPFDQIIAINNAWRVRNDWDYLIHPSDFDDDRKPDSLSAAQNIITYQEYVPAQNALGGFVYAGGTMAFTAGYWALHALKPTVLCYLGCDMVYDGAQTHFYGTGTPDPLRSDVTLRSLEAKSARLLAFAEMQGCTVLNMGSTVSRLVFPRGTPANLTAQPRIDRLQVNHALSLEKAAGYMVPSGKYWKEASRFDTEIIDEIDAAWRASIQPPAAKPNRPS